MERLDTAIAHGRRHDLVLYLASDELLAGASQFDEVDFEGARRHVCHFVCEAPEFGAVANYLKNSHVQLVEEAGDLGSLSDSITQLWIADDSGCCLRDVNSARVLTHVCLNFP